MLSVVFYVCCIGLFLSTSLAGPILVALLNGDEHLVGRLLLYLVLGAFMFGTPVLAIAGRMRRVPQIGSLTLVLLTWAILPLAASIPIVDLSDLSFVDSLFEAVSGLTTAGASTVPFVREWPQALVFWRVQLQWMGGFLAMLTVFLVLAPMGIGGLTISAFSIGKLNYRTAGWSRILSVIRTFGLYYILLTLIGFLALLFTGIRSFHAATLSMSAVATGGFLPFDEHLGAVLGPAGLFIFAMLALTGATSVFWHRMIVTMQWARLREHRESYSVLALSLALAFVLGLLIVRNMPDDQPGLGREMLEGLVTAVSLVSTLGVEPRAGLFALLPLAVVLFIILLGGSAYSTSGGLKHYRFGGMLVQSWSELDRLIYPSIVRPSRFGTQRYDLQLMKSIWSFFVAAIFTIAIGTVLVSTGDIPFEAALTATIASFATAAPVYESAWAAPGTPSWPTFASFSDGGKIALMLVMVAGRLEVLVLIGIFSAHYWRNR